jgi:excisionase family DNA binding protein
MSYQIGSPSIFLPEKYRHPSGTVVVPNRVAAWLARHAQLADLRAAHRGADPEVDAVLCALAAAAADWRVAVTGSADDTTREECPPSPRRLGTTTAATLLGISPRTMRWACAQGRLPAEQVGGRWQVDREDLEHWRATRRTA